MSTRRTPNDFNAWLKEVRPSWEWDKLHLRLIQRELMRIFHGENDRLLIVMPVRHGKSESTTIPFPAFYLEHRPASRILTGSYSSDLANRFSRRTRAIVRDRGVLLNTERSASSEWETAAGGGLRAAGRTGGVTGFGANGILLDDMVKSRAEAQSDTYRDAIWDTYNDDFATRLEPGGWIVVCMTWWHKDDLIGRILATEGDQDDGGTWKVLRLAALAEENDPIGRAEGEALWPERFNRETLLKIQARMGSSFNGLYQARPTPREGSILKHDWIRHHDDDLPDHHTMIVQSWDTGTKPKERNDPSVCTTWKVYRDKPFFRLEGQFRKRMDYPALKRAIVNEAALVGPDVILIEDKGNGTAAIQELKAETMLNLVAVEPIMDKLTRFEIQANQYRLGNVSHPSKKLAPWILPFDDELTTIPEAVHDDRGDSVSQFLAYASGKAQGFAFSVASKPLHSRTITE